MQTRIIGDVHGKYLSYLKLIENVERSVQIGDFGFGFGTRGEAKFIDSLIDQMHGENLIIRGNQDPPSEIARSSHFIPDGTIKNSTMFIGGASSIDRQYRIPGVDWWEDEQLSQDELDQLIEVYREKKPRVLITHEAPEVLVPILVRDSIFGSHVRENSRTRNAFDIMRTIHTPEIHVFGHWHTHMDSVIGGTRFICLNELEYIDLEI